MIGERILRFGTVTSTQDVAAEMAATGFPHGGVIVAEAQTAGRGRLGRAWHSPPAGGLYLSILLRPRVEPALLPLLTLAAGLAAADSVQALAGCAADLRWPNDVLLGGRKCCGILPEMAATADTARVKHVILGIGLNVNQREFPPALAAEATSLAMVSGQEIPLDTALALLLENLETRYNQFVGEPSLLPPEFESRSSFARNRWVLVENGGSRFTGVTEGLDSAGFLRVRRDDTGIIEPVLAGSVRPA